MKHQATVTIICAILLAALSRLIPHPPNFSPVIAMALFAGASLADRRLALIVPLAAMLLSDLLLGFHGTMVFVYVAMALVVLGGRWLGRRRGPWLLTSAAVGGSLLFFVVSNLGVWLGGGLYPLSGAGLLACFIAALPFLHTTLLSTLLYGGLFVAVERWAVGRAKAGLALV